MWKVFDWKDGSVFFRLFDSQSDSTVNKCSIIVLLLLAVAEDVEQIYKFYWKRANGESEKKVEPNEKRELKIIAMRKSARGQRKNYV